jgi:2-amino-4-hydroxy-6-hydroxymethyldihydropteridine diphosphokinase
MHNEVFLSLGSNEGDRQGNLEETIRRIGKEAGTIVKISSVYRTAAWGKTDQPDFLNQAIQLETSLTPEELLEKILAIEHSLGRVRTEKWAMRIIDIDILLFGQRTINSPHLSLPHPELANRRFVLVPLNEIAPEYLHPVLKKTIRELLAACPDQLTVARYEVRGTRYE